MRRPSMYMADRTLSEMRHALSSPRCVSKQLAANSSCSRASPSSTHTRCAAASRTRACPAASGESSHTLSSQCSFHGST